MGAACGPPSDVHKTSDHQFEAYTRKRVTLWQASLQTDAPVFRLDSVRGRLVPTSNAVLSDRKVILYDFLENASIEPGWVNITQTNTLGDDLYFVRTEHVYSLQPIGANAYAFNGMQCPLLTVDATGQLTSIGIRSSSTGFGFPLDEYRTSEKTTYVRVLRDHQRTGFVSGQCLEFGPPEVAASLKRIRAQISAAPQRAWDFSNPYSVRPDFEASVHQFIHRALLTATLSQYQAAVQRQDYWKELEDAIVAIFTHEIEAASLDVVIPGIWGFPTATITPLQVSLLATLLRIMNPDFNAGGNAALLESYFIDPGYGQASLSCAQNYPPPEQARLNAAEILRSHVNPTIDWLNAILQQSQPIRLDPGLREHTDTLHSILYAYDLLTNRESAIAYDTTTESLLFVPGEENSVRAEGIFVHNHPGSPMLLSADLRDIPLAAHIPFYQIQRTSSPTLEHPSQRLATRGASIGLIMGFTNSEPVFHAALNGDVTSSVFAHTYTTSILVRCPDANGNPYELWKHYNTLLEQPSEWRTPFGRVTLQPVAPDT